jgi:hypothetical protein
VLFKILESRNELKRNEKKNKINKTSSFKYVKLKFMKTFTDNSCGLLKVSQRFGNHCISHLQVDVFGEFKKPYIISRNER